MTIPSLNKLLLGKKYVGIEHFSSNNEEKIALLLVEKKNEELIISKKDKVTYSETVLNIWDKSLPFFLVINTNQVIQKEVSGTDIQNEKLLYKAFPNTNWDEFYFEIWRMKTKSIIAITRKKYLDELMSIYKKQSITVAGITLGVCVISELTNYSKEKNWITNHQSIFLNEENQIITPIIPNQNHNYNINDLEVQNSHLLAFSGVLRLLLQQSSTSGNIINYSHELYKNFKQNSFFTKGSKLMIGVLLTVLIVNFFAFTHYYKLARETSESLLLSKASLDAIIKTKQRIQVKELKVKSFVAMTSSQSSFIINEITRRIPQSILLNELIYHPLEKKIKSDENLVIQEKTIIVSGTTIENNGFTVWVEDIEQLKWINQVIITRFGKNDLNETEFSVKIILK